MSAARTRPARSRRPSTVEKTAALDWQPAPSDLRDRQFPGDEQWRNALFYTRVAYRLGFLTKAEAAAMVEKLAPAGVGQTLDGIRDTCVLLDGLAGMLRAAEARLVVAGSVVALQAEGASS